MNAIAAGGIVEIGDSGRYEETPSITVDAGATVELRAANEHRPTVLLSGDLQITLNPGAELSLNGLLITGGRLQVSAAGGSGTRTLRLRHCTLVPGLALTQAGDPASPGAVSLIVDAADATVGIDDCIIGPLRTDQGATIKIRNSIVDATAPERVAFSAPDEIAAGGFLTVVNSTIIGKVHSERFDLASNSIFAARLSAGDAWSHPVISEQNQQGCVRFSFVPINAIVPRRYRCQPDLAVATAITAADVPKGSLSNFKRQIITAAVQARVRPAFTTARYGQPGYAQLGSFCPVEIRTGAEDESEMGVFHDLFAPQRENNLRIRLQEYLRFGLEAGIFYST
jgi:hypothetical protein